MGESVEKKPNLFQFRLRTMMVGVAVLALWLASLRNQELAPRVPRILLMLLILAAVTNAVHFQGRKRAFWLGFVVLGGFHALRPAGLISKDDTDWLFNGFVIHLRFGRAIYLEGVIETCRALVTVLWGVLGGLVSLAMYLRWHENDEHVRR